MHTTAKNRHVTLVPVLLILASAAPLMAEDARIYRLNFGSTYQEGCFEPCACPVGPLLETMGTFRLQFAAIGNAVNFYDIRDINWYVQYPNQVMHITGKGYLAVSNHGGDFAAMSLELSINGATATVFNGEPVEGFGTDHLKTVLSINGGFCLDTVITIDASIVPKREVTTIHLNDQSSFQEGCLGPSPCDCAVFPLRELQGRLDLVPLYLGATIDLYAVADAGLTALPDRFSPEPKSARAVGLYRRDYNSDIFQSIMLSMEIDNAPPVVFEGPPSKIVVPFPRLDVTFSVQGAECFDQVFHVVGAPKR